MCAFQRPFAKEVDLMNRTNRETERRIIDLYFKGYSTDMIAAMTGAPPSTVTEVLKILPEELTYLRELSVDLKKHDLSVFDAKKGTELQARLADLGVGFEEMQSFVESVENIQTNPDYTPKQVVEAAMKLSNIEEKSGQTYSEALVDFEAKTKNLEKQGQKERDLKRSIRELDVERKKKLARNQITDEAIEYVVNLRQNLQTYGIKLDDAASLDKYLKNMRETGGDPKKFVEFTRKQGSLEEKIGVLKQEENRRKRVLQELQTEKETSKAAIEANLLRTSELDKRIAEEQTKLLALCQEVDQVQQKSEQELGILATRLRVEAETEKILDAIDAKQKKLEELDSKINKNEASLRSIQQRTRELENENNGQERQILQKLGINDYVTQLLAAIENLERQRLSLHEENSQKQQRLSLADTITSFLTKMPDYDFNQFYFYVEALKKIRETGSSKMQAQVPALEEEIRFRALMVFKGDLVSKRDYKILWDEKEEYKKAKGELEADVSKLVADFDMAKKKFDVVQRDRALLTALKMNFEGQSITLEHLRNWVISTFNEEIQRRTDEKLKVYANAALGVVDFIHKKITSRGNLSKGSG